MTIPWNIVTKNVSPDEARLPLEKKLRQKIGRLEKHLKHFPPDAVYLQIILERRPKKPIYTATLNLRVPSNIMHSEKSARDLIGAMRLSKSCCANWNRLSPTCAAKSSGGAKNAASSCIDSKM